MRALAALYGVLSCLVAVFIEGEAAGLGLGATTVMQREPSSALLLEYVSVPNIAEQIDGSLSDADRRDLLLGQSAMEAPSRYKVSVCWQGGGDSRANWKLLYPLRRERIGREVHSEIAAHIVSRCPPGIPYSEFDGDRLLRIKRAYLASTETNIGPQLPDGIIFHDLDRALGDFGGSLRNSDRIPSDLDGLLHMTGMPGGNAPQENGREPEADGGQRQNASEDCLDKGVERERIAYRPLPEGFFWFLVGVFGSVFVPGLVLVLLVDRKMRREFQPKNTRNQRASDGKNG